MSTSQSNSTSGDQSLSSIMETEPGPSHFVPEFDISTVSSETTSSNIVTPVSSTVNALKHKVSILTQKDKLKNKRIRRLQLQNWRLKKQVQNMVELVDLLKQKNLIAQELGEIITENFGKNAELFKRLLAKNKGNSGPKKYGECLRSFALTLNFFSPRAYCFVRDYFNKILPHPKTLSKWYSSISGQPGFTTEALNMLRLKAESSETPIFCSLVMDEIAIRKHIEWDGKCFHGYVNFGNDLQDPTSEEASQALVFMVVALNQSWKVPIGYFFIHSMNAEQKAELVKQCIYLLLDCKITITNLTFDGSSTNLSMARILGCNFGPDYFTTSFKISNNLCYILLDPSHMIKLIRNFFGEVQTFFNPKGEKIDFAYLKKLNEIQESEGLHLSNKLRKQHLLFFKQKMKTKLATQLLSKSVAESLLFCKNILKISEFQYCDATAEFIFMMNDAFDILNSRKLKDYGYKQAICKYNIEKIKEFQLKISEYILNLKLLDNKLIVNSPRKTGFLGILVSLESVIKLYQEVSSKGQLSFIPVYKLSQDHIELFFGSIRSHGGFNDNPTSKQFSTAYKKILIHSEIREGGLGNCIPLHQIQILNCSSGIKKTPESIINDRNVIYNEIEEENFNHLFNDHDYLFNTNLSEFVEQITIYIAGFTVKILMSKIKCEMCLEPLIGNKNNLLNSFIHFKDQGGLIYPSEDVISICIQVENSIRKYNKMNTLNQKNIISRIILEVLECIGNKVFRNLNETHNDGNCMDNHRIHLISAVISNYCKIRIHYICKLKNEKDKIRHYYKKLVLFKGQ